jgi:hypothetical protein
MSVVPVVRYMIVCEDWGFGPTSPRRVNVFGILNNIDSLDDPPYPLLFPQLAVVLMLTGGRGTGDAQIVFVSQDTGQRIFGTPKRSITFGPDPLAVAGVFFRIRDCLFPFPGLYAPPSCGTMMSWWKNDLSC